MIKGEDGARERRQDKGRSTEVNKRQTVGLNEPCCHQQRCGDAEPVVPLTLPRPHQVLTKVPLLGHNARSVCSVLISATHS